MVIVLLHNQSQVELLFLWCTNLAVIWFKPLMHYKQLQLLPGSQLKWEGGEAVLTIKQK